MVSEGEYSPLDLVLLSNHSQRVIINSILSSPVSVTSGASQGTVLGSLLFLVCINVLPDGGLHKSNILPSDYLQMIVFYIDPSNMNMILSS